MVVECACSVVCCKFCEMDSQHPFGFNSKLQAIFARDENVAYTVLKS